MQRTALHSRRSRRNRTSCSIIALATVMAVGATPAHAKSFNAEGTYFTNPNATGIVHGATTTTINLNGGQTVIDWIPDGVAGTGTNILFQGSGTTATFQSGSNFSVLNRIQQADLSRAMEINGTINARVGGVQKGNVYFYSPSGFVLGGSSVFSVGSLVLTTSPIQLTSGNFIDEANNNRVVFGQADSASSAIVSNGTIDANFINFGVPVPGGSYVALVAPRVEHNGAITVKGSAALVAAEAATISFSTDGLFDIEVTTGTTSTNAITVNGDIGGTTTGTADDQRRVYMVAVPKNDALTMAIGAGSDLGFTLANDASIDQYGAVVLSAGHDISNGDIGSRSAGHGVAATANLQFSNAHATNNVFGEATGNADITASGGLTAKFDSSVDVHAAGHAWMNSFGANSLMDVDGDLYLSTDRTSTTSGGSATGGYTSLFTNLGGSIAIDGNATLSANGFGGDSGTPGVAGGIGTGGHAQIQNFNGSITIGTTDSGGNVFIYANGQGGDGFANNGGLGKGGFAEATSENGNLTIRGQLWAEATGEGGSGGGLFTSGMGEGGDILIRAQANSLVSITDGIHGDASGIGGFTGFRVNGGDGIGGDIELLATGGSSTLNSGGDVVLTANGQAGDDGECIGCGGGIGGDGQGGNIDVGADNGSTLTLPGSLTLTANGYGGVGMDADGGLGKGGSVQVYAGNGGRLDLTGNLLANADGYGGERMDGGYGGDFAAIAGNGEGGFVELFTFGTGSPDLNLLSSVFLHADGLGGSNDVEGVAAFAGSGTGGTAWIDAQKGTLDISGSATVSATGEGGSAAFGAGGDGTGKNAEIDGIGGAVTIGGVAVVDVSGQGGDGMVGGDGFGGGELFEDGIGIDGAHIFAQNGSVTINGITTLWSRGEGGAGLDGAFETDGGTGGNGTGGWTAVTAANSNNGPSTITLSTLNISANATGGDGGQGGGGNQGGNGGAGGDATGGLAQVFANAGNGHLVINTVNATATATGGQGGDGGNGDGLGGGNGGQGGDAQGGSAAVGTASGNGQAAASNLGTATYGTISADASATGGNGGNGNSGSTAGNGGNGGDAAGGGATLLVRGSTVTVDTVTLTADADGGDAGFGYVPEVGTPGTTGIGGDATVGGNGNGIAVLATGRYLLPAQRGTLNAGSISGTAIASSGIGIPDGDSTSLGDSGVVFLNADGNIGSLDFLVGFGGQNTSASGIDMISVINGAVEVNGEFAFTTPGNLSFLIDNGSLTAGTIDLSAGNFVTDPVDAPPLNRGTAFADNVFISSGGDFIADADFDVTNTFSVSVPGSIRVGNVHDDSSIFFWAGGGIDTGDLDAGGSIGLFAGGSIDVDDITAGGYVDADSNQGSINFTNIQAGSFVDLQADSFIDGIDINAGGSIFAETFQGDINLDDLNSTFGSVTLHSGDDIFLSGNVLADGFIELTSEGNIVMQNATAGEDITLDSSGYLDDGGYIDGLNLTAGDSIDVHAGEWVDLGNLSAGLVNPSTNEGAEFIARVVAGGNILTGNIDAAEHVGLATPGTITTGDIDAGGIFMALAHGDMNFGDATADEVFLSDFQILSFGGLTATCIGNCGTLGANGVVTAPPTGPTYAYVTTHEGEPDGAGQLPGVGGEPTTGSLFTTSPFEVDAGQALDFWFNYVTSDGSGFADYAWAALYTPNLDPVAILFTARTQPDGTIIPGFGLPGVEATLTPGSVPIIDGGPVWSPLGDDSGDCFAAGCGYTGWVNSSYDIAEAGSYVLRFGVTNWTDEGFQSGMAFSGLSIGGVSLTPVLLTRTGGSITIGNVDTGKFSAAAGTSLTTGIIDSDAAITLDAGGAITTDNLIAGDFVLANGGSITTQNIEANSVDMTSTGGNITTGDVFAFGDVEMDSFGDITTGDITAASIDLAAGDDITTDNLTTQFQQVLLGEGGGITTLLFPGASITLEAGGDILTGDIDSIDGVYANAGGGISTGMVEANSFVLMQAVGNIMTGDVTAFSQIDLESSNGGIATQDLVSTDGDIDLDAFGNVSFASGDADTEFDFSAGGTVTGGNVVAGNQISGDAGGTIVLGNLTVEGPLSEAEPFSIGITAEDDMTVGNVTGAFGVGFGTLGDLTTGNIDAGELFMALVGGNTTINGSITTSGEAGGQVYIANPSMCEAGGGCGDDDDFIPAAVLDLDPVATGGSITINGPVTTGLFRAAAGTNFTANAISSGFNDIEVWAGNTATINGAWSASDIDVHSDDINITGTGSLNASDLVTLWSTNTGVNLIGDGLTGSGYALSNAEVGRIHGGSIAIVTGAAPGAAANTLVGDLTITAGEGGNIQDSDGGFGIATMSESGESTDGTLRVVGDVVGTGFTTENFLAFATEHFELDAAAGSIALSAPGGGLGGELGLYADTIHVAELPILLKLAANSTYTNYQQDLNKAATVQRPEGVIRADTLWIESENLQDILIQNMGTGGPGGTPAGFLIRQAFINDEVDSPPGAINLIINGQVVTEGGTLTGIDARDALVEGQDVSGATPNSTINGCPLTGECIIVPPPPPPTANVVDNQLDIFGNDPFGEDDVGDDQEGDEGANNPIAPPQPLFDTRPLIPSSEINDPVSGTGNPALLGSDAQCDEDEDGQCPANPVQGEQP